MIKQIIIAFFLGIIGTVHYVQQDVWCKQKIAQYICSQISQALDCTISSYTVKDLHITAGSITLNDIMVTPKNTDDLSWYWTSHTFTIALSWIDLILYNTIELILSCADLAIETEYNDQPAIMPHIQMMLYGPSLSLPVIIKQVSIQKAYFRGYEKDGSTRCLIEYAGQCKKIHNVLKTNIRITNGEYSHEQRTLFKQLYGSIQASITNIETNPLVIAHHACSVVIPALDTEHAQCHASGNWHTNKGLFKIKNNNNTFEILTKIHNGTIVVSANVPLHSIINLAYNTHTETVKGNCQLHAKGDLDKKQLKGRILCKEIMAAQTALGSLAHITFEKCNEKWHGSLYGQRKSGVACTGDWKFNHHTRTGSLMLANSTALFAHPSSHWRIPAHSCSLSCSFNTDGNLSGSFDCTAHHAKLHTSLNTHTHIQKKDGILECNGTIGNNTYTSTIQLHAQPQLLNFNYRDAQQKPLITIKPDNIDPNIFNSNIHFSCIKEAAHFFYGYNLQGEGIFNTKMTCDKHMIYTDVHLIDGTIRLPQTYNFINGFDAHVIIDRQQKKISFNDLVCSLHKGTVQSKHSTIYYTDDGSITFIHAPLLLQDCLLNIQKDLFANVSGRLLCTKQLHMIPLIKGNIILDRSQLNENLFSQTVQQSLMRNAKSMLTAHPNNTDIAFDITIASTHPVRVKTSFLETDAHIRLAISHTLQNPIITGSVYLNSGELHFPYKPLYINKGTIYFLPNQLYDPMIELEARNTIKNCTVTMHVNGSMQNHHIQLSSNPSLSEEQIMALLLVGSQEESLNIVMPALIMQNVKQLLFGSEQKQYGLERYFTGFLKPLKHISLVPSFVDQTGRGGLRAAVEINVHDKLRAVIQKNFSLTEDTRFEIEYMISDDISLKGVRDERRDVSSELEMKWKF